MDVTAIVSVSIAGLVAVAAAATGFGVLKRSVKTNTDTIKMIQDEDPVSAKECKERTKHMSDSIDKIADGVGKQHESIRGLDKFARYMLTKDGLSLSEVNDVLNGD